MSYFGSILRSIFVMILSTTIHGASGTAPDSSAKFPQFQNNVRWDDYKTKVVAYFKDNEIIGDQEMQVHFVTHAPFDVLEVVADQQAQGKASTISEMFNGLAAHFGTVERAAVTEEVDLMKRNEVLVKVLLTVMYPENIPIVEPIMYPIYGPQTDWDDYIGEVNEYFNHMKMENDKEKQLKFVSNLPLGMLKVVRALQEKGETSTIEDLFDGLISHAKNRKDIYKERGVFYNRVRNDDESFADFANALRELLETCGFSESEETLMLRTHFVGHLKRQELYPLLLGESTMSFDALVIKAIALQFILDGPATTNHEEVHPEVSTDSNAVRQEVSTEHEVRQEVSTEHEVYQGVSTDHNKDHKKDSTDSKVKPAKKGRFKNLLGL